MWHQVWAVDLQDIFVIVIELNTFVGRLIEGRPIETYYYCVNATHFIMLPV
jgi:hypothetical protein